MVTEEDYRYIVDDVYDVDSGRWVIPIPGGRLVAKQSVPQKPSLTPIDNPLQRYAGDGSCAN